MMIGCCLAIKTFFGENPPVLKHTGMALSFAKFFWQGPTRVTPETDVDGCDSACAGVRRDSGEYWGAPAVICKPP